MNLRMRTKLLLSLLSVSAGLTLLSLFVVQRAVQSQAKKEISTQLQNSIQTFKSFQRERERTLDRSAALLADLPTLRALMTTQHQATIQDASQEDWILAGSDLFLLADSAGRIVALHTSSPGFTAAMAQPFLEMPVDQRGQWWVGGGHLYEVFTRPIFFGPEAANHLLGFLAVGYEINDAVAAEVSRVAEGPVAFYAHDLIVKSTFTAEEEKQLTETIPAQEIANGVSSIRVGQERFEAASLDLSAGDANSVRLTVFKSYDQATSVLTSLNRLLLILGLAAMTVGSGLAFLISGTFTRPLGQLVKGVRALGRGDFSYPISVHGSDEVAEVTASFQSMRDNLLRAQQGLLEAERLATIGRMASSISHDLRHSLAAIVANAEFLCESKLSSEQREELYEEVRIAVNQMTDLIDSLLEFSRTRESLRPIYASVRETVDRSVQAVRAHPEFQRVRITVVEQGHSEGWFDARKLQRAISNLVLNACESVPRENGRVEVSIREARGGVEIRVSDNGRGIPKEVQTTLFDPFVSFGKENGTGLGLTVVQKIISDHGGEVAVERTAPQETVFRLWLPLPLAPETRSEGTRDEGPARAVVPKQSLEK
jgi:signal transduction histidine kinase